MRSIKIASDIPTKTILWILLIIFTGLTALYILKQTSEQKKEKVKVVKSNQKEKVKSVIALLKARKRKGS